MPMTKLVVLHPVVTGGGGVSVPAARTRIRLGLRARTPRPGSDARLRAPHVL